jgi:hypothetical protein
MAGAIRSASLLFLVARILGFCYPSRLAFFTAGKDQVNPLVFPASAGAIVGTLICLWDFERNLVLS